MKRKSHFQRISRVFSICMAFLLLFGTLSACVSRPESEALPESAGSDKEKDVLEPLVFDFSQVAPLEASKQGRTEANSRMFDALIADNSFARFAFEINDDFGTAEIEALYENLYAKVVEFLKTFPISLYEKPEIVFVGYTDEPGIYKQHARIPYSMVKQGDVDEFILRAFLTQSEPWLSYGVADYLFAEPKTVDLSLMEDTEKLYLTGLSFELPYVTEAERDNAIALAGSFVRYIIEKDGEEAILSLLDGSSTLDIYAMIQDWSGTSNSFLEAHPEVLDGSLNYYDYDKYDVKVDDGAFEIYFRLRDVEPASGLDSPVKLYGFVNRIRSAAKQISDFANEHDIPVIDSNISVFTETDTELAALSGLLGGEARPSMIVFSPYDGWRATLEHEMIHVMFGRKVGEDGPNSPLGSEGLTELLTNYLIFDDQSIYEMGGVPEGSAYNILRSVKFGELKETDFIFPSGFKAFQRAAEYYEHFDSLDKGKEQFDYALFLDGAAYGWLLQCDETGEVLEDMFSKDLAGSKSSYLLSYEAGASYFNYLINQKGYSVKDLVDAYHGDMDIEDYTQEWAAWIREKLNAVKRAPLVFDFSQAAPLEASKQGRTEANSRMFDALIAENSFARFVFEINDDFGTAEIEALYEDFYTKVVEFLKTFPIQLYEKPEIVFVGYTDEPGIYKQHARIPYSMVKQGDVDEFILRAFLTQSEPWLSYGIADYLFAELKTVDLSLMEDTEKLYLTGLSFEPPYVTEAERDNAIALAGSFVRYIIEEHGEEAIPPLFNGNSTLDIYAMIQDWSGTGNSYYEAHPEVLNGSLSYYDIESYDVIVDDGAFEFYFRLRDVEPASGLDSPVKLYGFVNRIRSAAKQISDFANEHDVSVIDRGIRAYTDTDTDFYSPRSAQAGPSEVIFSSNTGWSTAVEHELVHVMFGRKAGEDGPNSPLGSEGLTTLLTDYLIFDHRDIFEMGGIPDRSFYNNLMWLKAGEFDESDLIYADELEAGQKVVECYEQFASLDKGESQFDYALYIDSLAYVWLIHCKKTGEAVEDMFRKDLARSSESSPLAYYAGASYHNYLINQKGYSVKDLLDAYYGDIPIEDYTAEWIAWIREKFNAVKREPLVFDFSQVAPLEAFKQGRDETNSRMFNALKADNSFVRFIFEDNDEFDTAEIEALYEDLYTKVADFLQTFPIQLYEKPEIMFVRFANEPAYFEQRAIIPYSMVKQGDVDKFILRAFLTQSEPWLSYGVADYLFAEPKDVDLRLIEDVEKLYLTGLSFELPYVTEEERDNAIALAGSFVRYIIEEHGEEAIPPLFNGNSTLDIYAMIQDWSGTGNSYYEAHPEVLYGSFSYSDVENYEVQVDDGAFKIHFRLSDLETVSPLDTPVALYDFVNYIRNTAIQISEFAHVHGIPVKDSGIEVYTADDDKGDAGGRAAATEIRFSSNGWHATLEHEMIHVMFGIVGINNSNNDWTGEGLTTLLENHLIFGQDRFVTAGVPESSYYNILREVRSGELKDSDFTFKGSLKDFQRVVEYYEHFDSLDKDESQFNYPLFIDATVYAWLDHCDRTGRDVEEMFNINLMSIYSYHLSYQVVASYLNFLINQKGYSAKDLVESFHGDIQIDDYTAEWLSLIRENMNELKSN